MGTPPTQPPSVPEALPQDVSGRWGGEGGSTCHQKVLVLIMRKNSRTEECSGSHISQPRFIKAKLYSEDGKQAGKAAVPGGSGGSFSCSHGLWDVARAVSSEVAPGHPSIASYRMGQGVFKAFGVLTGSAMASTPCLGGQGSSVGELTGAEPGRLLPHSSYSAAGCKCGAGCTCSVPDVVLPGRPPCLSF